MAVSRGLAYKALGCARLSGGLTEPFSEFLIVFWRPAAVRARQGGAAADVVCFHTGDVNSRL